MQNQLARYGLLLGNFATGLSVLAPAGMLAILAEGLNVGIREAGLLVTFGAIILCFGSPVMAWLTTRIGRRALLVTTLAVMAAGQAAMALAPNYGTVLAFRLVTLAIAAVFTPQAASTIGLLVSDRARSGAITFIFLGWSLAVAAGMPLITLIAAYAGWRGAFAFSAFASFVPCVLLAFGLPRKLFGPALSLGSFTGLLRNTKVLMLLAITILFIGGQFMVFVYLGPLLNRLTGASHETVGLIFALYGVMGFIGNVTATRIVGRLGGWKTSVIFLACNLCGLALWTAGSGVLVLMAAGVVFLGLGFAATNSIQQARLVQTAPELASASVALNTSSVYVGQAIGSGLGGVMYAAGMLRELGMVGVVFVGIAIAIWTLTRDRVARPASS
ncbi:MFS transporter [Pseudolabrys sp. Root1462]|uniref:MFS transporter n=1 Tax=Pseudolabrys sp. Root1462 TaxID=1736466 RepID=UPI0007031B86|nr:MFS transporter [Pseudolabrys sp. Root1462]KQZ00373.1 MFS transporter [Pseudolabrys sp. Root1462]